MSVCISAQFCKGCGICVAQCPKQTLTIFPRSDGGATAVVEQMGEEQCVDCGTCQDVCPDFAIWVCRD